MEFSLFFNFDGDARAAADFYAAVFRSEVQDRMTYAEMPADPSMPVADADKSRIAYSNVPICGCNVMICDVPSGSPLIVGNNISPTVGPGNAAECRRLFAALEAGGTVEMPLQKTFWSALYGMVTDRYGITWQISCAGDEN